MRHLISMSKNIGDEFIFRYRGKEKTGKEIYKQKIFKNTVITNKTS